MGTIAHTIASRDPVSPLRPDELPLVDKQLLRQLVAQTFAAMGIRRPPVAARLHALVVAEPAGQSLSQTIIGPARGMRRDGSLLGRQRPGEALRRRARHPVVNAAFLGAADDRMICLSVGTGEIISALVRKRNARSGSVRRYLNVGDRHQAQVGRLDLPLIPAEYIPLAVSEVAITALAKPTSASADDVPQIRAGHSEVDLVDEMRGGGSGGSRAGISGRGDRRRSVRGSRRRTD